MLDPTPQLEDHGTTGPIPIQFRLRSLLWVVALFSTFFAAITTLSTVWAALIVIVAVLAISHVAAAAICIHSTDHIPRSRAEPTAPTGPLLRADRSPANTRTK